MGMGGICISCATIAATLLTSRAASIINLLNFIVDTLVYKYVFTLQN